MAAPSISILIRVRNEGRYLRQVLAALRHQDLAPLEILVVDNESTDDSRAVAEAAGARILTLARGEFTYGRALNLALAQASGEFVCILSAHSLPIGSGFLRTAVAPFADPSVAAVRCLSVTNRNELENWMAEAPLEGPAEFDRVIAEAPVNCASVIRRSVWERIRYDESVLAVEDKVWAAAVLRAGYRTTRSAALYLYMREFGVMAQVRKMRLDRLAYFRLTGRQFAAPPIRLGRLLVTLLYRIPKRALRAAIYETALYASIKSIPLEAHRKHRSGSC